MKLFKPFIVIFNNNSFKIYGTTSEFSKDSGISVPTIKSWLHKETSSYYNYGIIGINYLIN